MVENTIKKAEEYKIDEKLKVFPLRSGTRQECPLSLLICNILLETLANTKDKEMKGI